MSALRDQRIGRLLAARGCRAIAQAQSGGTPLDNVIRMAEWRNRYALVPEEMKLPDEPESESRVMQMKGGQG